jgi:hypothetical protein
MDQRRRVALAVILLAGVSLAAGALWLGIRSGRRFSDPRYLLSRFPAENGLVLRADFSVLRRAGLLAPSKTPLEPDYKQFVDGTGFDYKRDLDFVIVSLSASGNFFIARGRFDWNKLRDYAMRQGGSCYEQLCRMPGSTPERRISFLPLRGDTIALAVGTNDLEAARLTRPGDPVTTPLPSAPGADALGSGECRPHRRRHRPGRARHRSESRGELPHAGRCEDSCQSASRYDRRAEGSHDERQGSSERRVNRDAGSREFRTGGRQSDRELACTKKPSRRFNRRHLINQSVRRNQA